MPRIGWGGVGGGWIVDDYFYFLCVYVCVCVCVCDSIFPACVGALICETKNYLSYYLWKEEKKGRHMEKELER
jgi:hypothetical protein